VKNRRPDFKRQALTAIREILGAIPVSEFRRSDASHFMEQRVKQVKPATVNRGLAVLKNMFTFAVERELMEAHPLVRFSLLPEQQRSLHVMTIHEERSLIESVANYDLTIAAYSAVLGETGLRKSEGLRLEWSHIDAKNRLVAVEQTKSGKARYVPLTSYALEWISTLTRVVGVPYLFLKENRERWVDPRGPFLKGRKDAGLPRAGFHDLRYVLSLLMF
jgi:integrase